MKSVGEITYSKAVAEGSYDLFIGHFFGKHDNVRTYWEDQLTRMFLRPFLEATVQRSQDQKKGVRVLDLGCGSGQGYQILSQIDRCDLDLGLQHDRVLTESGTELYLGLDISQAMVEKGTAIFADKPQVRFQQADLSLGLGEIKHTEEPFDFYFSSYGSLSHLSRGSLVTLLTDVCDHTQGESYVVLDLVGRYSIEWPGYWNAATEEEKVRDYAMSYLLSEEERKNGPVESFPLRFWTGDEVKDLAKELAAETGATVTPAAIMDRSVLVGRHTDTREYNPNFPLLRRTVNLLHEDYVRTDLDQLIIDADVIPEHPLIKPYLGELVRCWNILVRFCQERLRQQVSLVAMKGWEDFPSPLQFALMTMDRVIADVGWMWFGDPRANIIEPQLGYALRGLEYQMQQGLGCGHATVAVFRINK